MKPSLRQLLAAHHEESETFQNPDGRWQNFYGSKPAMGLPRLPLDSYTYPTSQEADAAADIRSKMFPAPAEPDLTLGLRRLFEPKP